MNLLKKIGNWDLKIPYTNERRLRIKFRAWRENIHKQPLKNHKVFCIGFHKTGTTSLERALKQMGFILGETKIQYMLYEEIFNKKYDRLINFCYTADAFQDTPFFMKDVYKILDKEFPKSKFILTVRDNENIWFSSMYNFFIKNKAKECGKFDIENVLKNDLTLYKGHRYDVLKILYPNSTLFDESYYKNCYLEHNKEVRDYFKNRPEDLLVLNVAEKNSYQKLAQFLDIRVKKDEKFPWENKTSDKNIFNKK
jgi:hypothetical protein